MWRFQKSIKLFVSKRDFNTTYIKYCSKFVISDEVMCALQNKAPIVALESTIITHGMPYPENMKCALDVEKEIRRQGAIPATIAILGGKVNVGLNHDQISYLADTKINKSVKTSRRDFPYVISQKLNGGTTVSGTIIVAEKVGIPVFVTGGIGGVHRQGENTLDISADLTELGRSSIAVVSAGVKSILDIPRTLEYLETQGVFVATFGDTTNFPAFYSRKSGTHAPYNVNSPKEAAKIIVASLEVGQKSGMLFAVPVPEEFALDERLLQDAIEKALKDAEKQGISGKHITPFLLSAVAKITQGKSLKTNIALIKNNAKIGAQIAVELSKYTSQDKEGKSETTTNSSDVASPVVIGGCIVDCCANIQVPEIELNGALHYTKFNISAGGVGRNICEALQKLGAEPSFLSVVGDDHNGQYVRSLLKPSSIKSLEVLPGSATAQCTIVLDSKGDCKILLGQVDILKEMTPDLVKTQQELLKRSPLIVADGNLPLETLDCVLEIADKYRKPVFYEPTDATIATGAFTSKYSRNIKYMTPNLNELRCIANYLNLKTSTKNLDPLSEACELGKLVSQYVDNILVTLGPLGLVIIRKGSANDPLFGFENKSSDLKVRHYITTEVKQLENVSGAGDCLASGIILAMLSGCPESICISVGFTAAQMALQSVNPVPKNLFDKTHSCWNTHAPFVELQC